MLIDPAQGSREFLQPLRRLGVPCQLRRLDVADFTFRGNGPNGLVKVGVERKRITEITDTIGGDKRFIGRQLPKLLKAHPEFPILIVEGLVRPDRDGRLLRAKIIERTRKRRTPIALFFDDRYARTTYERYHKFLATVRFKARLFVIPTIDEIDTAFVLHALYTWFQKRWADHKSVYRVEEQPTDRAILDERTFRRQTFAQWPGVGWKRSARVSRYFKSVEEGATADERTWMKALGIREGRLTARRLVAILKGKRGESDAEAKG